MSRLTKFQLIFVTFLIAVGTFFAGYYFGKAGYLFELRKNPPEIKITNQYPGDQEVDFALFWEVWELVQSTYLERPVDGQAMMYGAIEGMVQSLGDPYTSFLPPELNETVNNSINGTYQGIGAELGIRDEQLIIVAPLDGSPAQAAGVRAGDKILSIDGTSTVGLSLTEAVSKIRGESGTVVTLTLQRDAEEPFEAVIKRGVITVDSVTWEDKGDGIGYIRLSRFGGDTVENWQKSVAEMNSQMEELDVVILDLRGNPGGYLGSAVEIAEEFFADGVVLYQESATGEQIPMKTERVGAFGTVPQVIVLIDEGSASASEILAAALKSNIDATLLGQKSFGKGTIQDAKDFEDGSGVHITVSKWLTPEKVWVHGEGITPDLVVEQDEEDIKQEVDTQLETAIELAKKI